MGGLKLKKCKNCGETIPPKRLKIVPDTKYCLDCLEQLEADGKGTKRITGYFHVEIEKLELGSVEVKLIRPHS